VQIGQFCPLVNESNCTQFISDDPHCIDEIYQIAAEVGVSFEGPDGQSLSEALESKIVELTEQFEALYGESGDVMWNNLLKQYFSDVYEIH